MASEAFLRKHKEKGKTTRMQFEMVSTVTEGIPQTGIRTCGWHDGLYIEKTSWYPTDIFESNREVVEMQLIKLSVDKYAHETRIIDGIEPKR